MRETSRSEAEREKPPQKTGRPRDEFGRPLPRGAKNRLQLANFDALSVDENHLLGIDYLNAGNYFGAHEAWETAWRMSKGSEEEEFFKGFSQLGAGYTHYARGNPTGACALLSRGLSRIRVYAPSRRGLDLDKLARAVQTHIDTLDGHARGDTLPEISAPRL
jgi:predicted metal-dependent hydrolase